MGYMRHHAIIVTSWIDGLVVDAHEKAMSLGMIVTPVVETQMNGYHSFLIAPDGSKEGWEESNAGDARREGWKAWARSQVYDDGSTALKWVEVQYADDNLDTRIVADSDEEMRVRFSVKG